MLSAITARTDLRGRAQVSLTFDGVESFPEAGPPSAFQFASASSFKATPHSKTHSKTTSLPFEPSPQVDKSTRDDHSARAYTHIIRQPSGEFVEAFEEDEIMETINDDINGLAQGLNEMETDDDETVHATTGQIRPANKVIRYIKTAKIEYPPTTDFPPQLAGDIFLAIEQSGAHPQVWVAKDEHDSEHSLVWVRGRNGQDHPTDEGYHLSTDHAKRPGWCPWVTRASLVRTERRKKRAADAASTSKGRRSTKASSKRAKVSAKVGLVKPEATKKEEESGSTGGSGSEFESDDTEPKPKKGNNGNKSGAGRGKPSSSSKKGKST